MPRDPLTQVARQRAAVERAALQKRDDEARAIIAAREAGRPWSDIASALGVSNGQARWLAQRYMDAQSATNADTFAAVPRSGPRVGRGPGVSVTEASRRLGVTRRTVYAWVESGRIASTRNELGQTRCLLDDGPMSGWPTETLDSAP